MGEALNLNNLLDIDELTNSQQEYIKGLVSYNITEDNNKYNLEFKVIGTKYLVIKYPLEDNLICPKAYKHIMYWIIERNASKVKDPKSVKKIKSLLAHSPLERSSFLRPIALGRTKFPIKNESCIKSKNLYGAVRLVMEAV